MMGTEGHECLSISAEDIDEVEPPPESVVPLAASLENLSPKQLLLQTFPWVVDFRKLCQSEIGMTSMGSLEKLMKFFHKLPEAENGEKSSSANMSSKEEKKSVFYNKLLKKIIVKIVRNPHRQSDAVLQRAILNPATITPVRRPDEGNCPIFDRKELLEFKNNQHSSEEEPATRVVTESKKRISGGTTPRNRSKRRSRSRTRSRSTSSRRSCSSFSRGSKERNRSRERSYRSHSRSKTHSRSRSYERRRHARSRSHSHERRRKFALKPQPQDIRDPRYLEELLGLKAQMRRRKEDQEKHLKEEQLRKEKGAGASSNNGESNSNTSGGPRGRPRMWPPVPPMVQFRPMMVPFPVYPPHPVYRPPPFRPYPPPYPPNPRFHPPQD